MTEQEFDEFIESETLRLKNEQKAILENFCKEVLEKQSPKSLQEILNKDDFPF